MHNFISTADLQWIFVNLAESLTLFSINIQIYYCSFEVLASYKNKTISILNILAHHRSTDTLSCWIAGWWSRDPINSRFLLNVSSFGRCLKVQSWSDADRYPLLVTNKQTKYKLPEVSLYSSLCDNIREDGLAIFVVAASPRACGRRRYLVRYYTA